jgi:hypothetical protein
MSIQAMVDGMQVIVSVDGTQYDYRSAGPTDRCLRAGETGRGFRVAAIMQGVPP